MFCQLLFLSNILSARLGVLSGYWFHNDVQDCPDKTVSVSEGYFRAVGWNHAVSISAFFLPNSAVQPHQFQQPPEQILSLISECITKWPKLKYSQPVLYKIEESCTLVKKSAGQFLAIDGTGAKKESGLSCLPSA